ncbi:hypothetical protein [uncultured Roseibium sp.]|uniref:hypothetical protein n=1 Tax=uncultured Roseibium sp. TaxID=1936171 RepID=UPI002597935F|nr:hypothetical protein [uncultured Roseibium sp.]
MDNTNHQTRAADERVFMALRPTETLSPTQFGVVYDDQSAASANLANLNDCLSYASAHGYSVALPPRSIFVDVTEGPVELPSSTLLDGGSAYLVSVSDDRPVLVSQNWLAGKVTGNTQVHNLTIVGTGRGENQHGIILRDYFSTLRGVNVHRMGGVGILIEDRDRSGKSVDGTLVENKVLDCRAMKCAGGGLRAGREANNKITDGILKNFFVRMPDGSSKPPVFIGASAGWFVDNIHTYGGQSEYGLVISNGYNTHVGALYVETFTQAAVFFHSVQQLTYLEHLVARGNRAGAKKPALVQVSPAGYVEHVDVTLNSIQFDAGKGLSGPIALVANQAPRKIDVTLNGYAVRGPNRQRVYLSDHPDSVAGPVSGLKAVAAGRNTDPQLQFHDQYLATRTRAAFGGGGNDLSEIDLGDITPPGATPRQGFVSLVLLEKAGDLNPVLGMLIIRGTGANDLVGRVAPISAQGTDLQSVQVRFAPQADGRFRLLLDISAAFPGGRGSIDVLWL